MCAFSSAPQSSSSSSASSLRSSHSRSSTGRISGVAAFSASIFFDARSISAMPTRFSTSRLATSTSMNGGFKSRFPNCHENPASSSAGKRNRSGVINPATRISAVGARLHAGGRDAGGGLRAGGERGAPVHPVRLDDDAELPAVAAVEELAVAKLCPQDERVLRVGARCSRPRAAPNELLVQERIRHQVARHGTFQAILPRRRRDQIKS